MVSDCNERLFSGRGGGINKGYTTWATVIKVGGTRTAFHTAGLSKFVVGAVTLLVCL